MPSEGCATVPFPFVRQGFSGKLIAIVSCGIIGWVSAVGIGEDEVVSVLRFRVGAGVVGAEVETWCDVGTLATLGGARNQQESKDESSSRKQELCAGPGHQLNQWETHPRQNWPLISPEPRVLIIWATIIWQERAENRLAKRKVALKVYILGGSEMKKDILELHWSTLKRQAIQAGFLSSQTSMRYRKFRAWNCLYLCSSEWLKVKQQVPG